MLKLLLIDDEEPIRVALARSLRSDGYEVVTAENGEKGIEVFKKERPTIVLTDIKMPGMDGIEVLKRIKEISPRTEVIVITGTLYEDMDVTIQSLQLDASDFITEPITDEGLTIALRRAKEKLDIRKKLKECDDYLEDKVKEATEELRERYEFETNLIQYSVDGIIAIDKQENIIIFNQSAESLFGYSKDEVIGKMDIRSLYPPEIAEEIIQSLSSKERETKGMHRWRETFVLGKDGHKIPVRFSATKLYQNGEAIGCVGFFNNLRE